MNAASMDPAAAAATGSGAESIADAARSVGDLAGDVRRLGVAWFELARAEMVVARLSATRLAIGAAFSVLLVFSLWFFACLGLGYWLSTVIGRLDAAFAVVALLNVAFLVALALRMRTWWRSMQMSDSRAALGDIARSLS